IEPGPKAKPDFRDAPTRLQHWISFGAVTRHCERIRIVAVGVTSHDLIAVLLRALQPIAVNHHYRIRSHTLSIRALIREQTIRAAFPNRNLDTFFRSPF